MPAEATLAVPRCRRRAPACCGVTRALVPLATHPSTLTPHDGARRLCDRSAIKGVITKCLLLIAIVANLHWGNAKEGGVVLAFLSWVKRPNCLE